MNALWNPKNLAVAALLVSSAAFADHITVRDHRHPAPGYPDQGQVVAAQLGTTLRPRSRQTFDLTRLLNVGYQYNSRLQQINLSLSRSPAHYADMDSTATLFADGRAIETQYLGRAGNRVQFRAVVDLDRTRQLLLQVANQDRSGSSYYLQSVRAMLVREYGPGPGPGPGPQPPYGDVRDLPLGYGGWDSRGSDDALVLDSLLTPNDSGRILQTVEINARTNDNYMGQVTVEVNGRAIQTIQLDNYSRRQTVRVGLALDMWAGQTDVRLVTVGAVHIDRAAITLR